MVARSGNGWVLAPSLCTLVDQFDHTWPGRDRSSDGSIGDVRHQHETQSDHNPDHGYVDAVDIDTDLGPAGQMAAVCETLRAARDGRVNYFIFDRRMVRSYDKPGIPAWNWAPYTGSDPHTSHLHMSIKKESSAREDTRPWALNEEDDVTDQDIKKIVDAVNAHTDARVNTAANDLATSLGRRLADIEAALAKS